MWVVTTFQIIQPHKLVYKTEYYISFYKTQLNGRKFALNYYFVAR